MRRNVLAVFGTVLALPKPREWASVLLLALMIFVCDYGLLFWAEQRVPSGIAAVIKATIPMFIGQAAHGELEWTPGDKPGIGRGDGVMIAGDVRTLARNYCEQGVAVEYREYESLSHITSLPIWQLDAIDWIKDRFANKPAPQNCAEIAPGNPIDPIPAPA